MFGRVPEPRHMPCSECGAPLQRGGAGAHECDPERRLDYELFQLREEVGRFDAELAAYLASNRGRFELWSAERDRLRRERSEADD